MKKFTVCLSFGFCLMLFLSACRQTFNPPAIAAVNNYLVVDGVINIRTNGITTINLNRTRNLGDTIKTGIPELNANVNIEGEDGTSYHLIDSSGSGFYSSAPLFLNLNQKYRYNITTGDARKYLSDYVPAQVTPPLDSLYYRQPGDLTFYVDTHDPMNNTHYYRWDYVETWAHDATLSTPWVVVGDRIEVADTNNQTTYCWTTRPSSEILLGNSSALSADIIKQQQILVIPQGDIRLDKRYSLLFRQYALTEDAYTYWKLIQKTSEQVGSLFDVQPTQLVGNIHCVTNPNEPVIGFASASTVEQTRIFIYQSTLNNWMHNSIIYACDTLEIPVNVSDYRIYVYPDTLYAPYYFITNGPLVLASKTCLDCLLTGGTNKQPSFW